MAIITAQQILNKAALLLQDPAFVRWTSDELLGWLNDGQREIVMLKPDANAVNQSVQLSAGTKQRIPSDGIRLIKLTRNMGNDGDTPGRTVRFIDGNILDTQRPNWHTETASTTVLHYAHDVRDPKVFYCYPPQPGTPSYVELVYSAIPEDVALTDAINLDDIYATVLTDYVLYRAYSKNAAVADPNIAAAYYQAFYQALGLKAQGDISASPDAKAATNSAGGAS